MENYEQLLGHAYENITRTQSGGRFEIKKVEGHIEGNKTVITNFMRVSNCLRRRPEHLSKFLFKELASSGEITGDRLILTRRISSGQINEKIKKYVNLFVICLKCKKPDTELTNENNQKFIRCLACGNKNQVMNKI